MRHAFTLLCYQAPYVFILQNWNSVPMKQSFLSHPQPLADTTVLSIPMNWTPLGHVRGIIQHLPACDRSVSISTMSSRFIHAVAGVRISLYFLQDLFVFSYGGSLPLIWAFSSRDVWASYCGGFSCCRARTPGTWASTVAARGLRSCDAWT